jgi:hypothetical protein
VPVPVPDDVVPPRTHFPPSQKPPPAQGVPFIWWG